MDNSSDIYWMTHAFELAVQGKSRTQPNPMVGCVIVHEGKVIGEGYHRAFGKAHAEVEALKGIEGLGILKDATAYVSLEPCSHHGNTPPCAEFLVKCGIGRVVTAMEDPNPKVKGRGHEILKQNKVQVLTGVLENEASEMNRIFIHLQNSKLPYITLKWAQSLDGFIDPETSANSCRGSIKISSEESSVFVQNLRSHHNSILIGKKTALVDSPNLTSKEIDGVDPIRIVIDPNCEISTNHFDIVICNSNSSHKTNVKHCETLDQGLNHTLFKLREMGVYSILVEGGAYTLKKFIENDLWNEAYIFESPINLSSGLKAPDLDFEDFETSQFGIDTLYHKIR